MASNYTWWLFRKCLPSLVAKWSPLITTLQHQAKQEVKGWLALEVTVWCVSATLINDWLDAQSAMKGLTFLQIVKHIYILHADAYASKISQLGILWKPLDEKLIAE